MRDIAPCLWFDNEAEEAANFYVSLFPNSRIDHIQRNVTENPSGPKNSVLIIDFTLKGRPFQALNGGQRIEYTHAISLSSPCADQAEVDRLWNALGDGGTFIECGWVKDRYGVSWQVFPEVLPKMLADADTARAARVMRAMMGMVKIDVAGLEAAYRG